MLGVAALNDSSTMLSLMFVSLISIYKFFLFPLKVYPPGCLLDNPINAVTTKFVRTSTNKLRCPIFCVAVSKMLFVCLSEELYLD